MADIDYITFPIPAEPEDMVADAIAYIQTVIPGWQPHDGNLDTIMLETFSAMAADVKELASEVPSSIFRYFGANLIGVQPIDATPATVQSTWTAIDTAGHTINAGVQVGIRNSSGDLIPFYVQTAVVIPPGSSATSAGAVTLIAVDPGAATSGLGSAGGPVERIEILDWVNTIVQTAVTSGGVDAESDSAYLARLRQKLQLLSPRPILPSDFSTLALDVAGVAYAVAIDGYDPTNGTFNNERMVAVALLDANGNPVSNPIKASVAAYLDSLREVNFVVNAIDPTITQIDVNWGVKAVAGATPSDVLARVNAALTSYLNPAVWIANSTGTPTTTIRYLELAQVINSVDGVDYITSLTFGIHGGTISQADLVMSGPSPLPMANTLTGAVA